jgi:hypothetical protein
MKRQASSRWTPILIAALLACVAKLAPVAWAHVLTGLVIAGGNLPL